MHRGPDSHPAASQPRTGYPGERSRSRGLAEASTPSAPPVGDEPAERLRQELMTAAAAASNAYRDTTRLIRLLMVLGQPAVPEELVDQTLTVLSEVFLAEVTCVAEVIGDRLLVTGSCGLPEDDPAFRDGWPVGHAAAEAVGAARVVARSGGVDLDEVPAWVANLGIGSAAWVPLSDADVSDLLILFRCCGQAFTQTDLEVLSSVAYRLGQAVRERERNAAIEWLAQSGHLLGRHLELEPLLDEAVGLLRQLTGADSAWVVTLDGGEAVLRAHRGLPGRELGSWPRQVSGPDDWRPAVQPLRSRANGADTTGVDTVTRVDSANGVDSAGGENGTGVASANGLGGAADSRAPGGVERGTLLRVPVLRDGAPVALLFAARDRPRAFARDALETAAIFANYLGVAMANADLYRTLRARATHDPLTGLANRVLVRQRLDEALGRDAPTHIGLLFCDLDRFKAVNDRLGHEAGDELLQQVAWRLRGCVRSGDLLARFGGDEFVIVVDGVHRLAEVAAVGRQVAHALDHAFVLRGERVRISASVGGVLGVRGSTASAMLRDADAAMYAAKEKGLGQVEVFDEAASHRSLDRLDLRSELLHALDRGELRVYYQPIFTLDSKQILAFEALLRWTHPSRGFVPPEVFIALAEETGAIVPIGRWVLDQACRQLASWQRLPAGRGVQVSVNLSAAQLRQPRLAAQTLAVLRNAGVRPGDLWLEITEHSYACDEMTGYAAALRAAGVHFALDDFGMAYSNLGYLRRLPIEILKIDRSFVGGLDGQQLDPVVRAILAVAESLGLRVVAEGVETEDQRGALLALGCQLGQGNLLSRPLAAGEATDFLAATAPPAPAPGTPAPAGTPDGQTARGCPH